jgi:hypothetical protein
MKRFLMTVSAAVVLSTHMAIAQSASDLVQTALNDKTSDGSAYLEPALVAAFKRFVATGCEQIYSFSAWVDGPNRQVKVLSETEQSARVQVRTSNGTDIVSLLKGTAGWKIHDACGASSTDCYRAYLLKAKCE